MREKKRPAINQNIVDKVIEYFDPNRAARRLHARTAMSLAKNSGGGGYHSGKRNKSANKNWALNDGSANAVILPDLDLIRSDSRDLLRKTPLARGAINTVVTSVVGTGLIPQSRLDFKLLNKLVGLSEQQVVELQAAMETEFDVWAMSCAGDVTRKQTFYAQQRLVIRSTLESGDIFPLRRMISRPGVRHETSIQLIEADRISTPQGQTENAFLHAGVERDQYGAAIAYHVMKTHPGDRWIEKGRYESQRVPARMDNGDWLMLQVMTTERPEQTRGVPYLAPVVNLFKQLSDYSDSELTAALINSLFAVFVQTDGGKGINIEGSGPSAKTEINLKSGMMIDLMPGEEVEFADPTRPNINFDPFVVAILRQIGVALEIPFEILIKHFTASYSAAQAAIVEAWKFFTTMRSWLVEQYCQHVYAAVITECVAKGYINAPGFFSDPFIRAAYLQAEWIGPPRGMIDQKKEAEANAIFEDRGWKTGKDICAELVGGDWDQKLQRRIYEQRMRINAGLIPSLDQTIDVQPDADPSDDDTETEGSLGDYEDN